MSGIGWQAILPAIQDWIVSAADVADEKVYIARQGGPQQAFPYFVYDITETNRVGHDWVVKQERELGEDETLEDFPGEEMVRKVRGHRTAVLTIECFSDGVGAVSAVALLEEVISHLPLHEYDLDEAGAGIGNITAVTYGGGRRGGNLQPRAQVEVQLHLASDVQDYVTYIERTQITVRETTTEAEVELWVPDPPPET